MTGPKVGDRIRTTYTYEGVVDKVNTDGGVSFSDDDGYNYWSPGEDECTLEILERAKPVVTNGDVARAKGWPDQSGIRFAINGEWKDRSGMRQWDNLVEPIESGCYELLLRDGKPVAQ